MLVVVDLGRGAKPRLEPPKVFSAFAGVSTYVRLVDDLAEYVIRKRCCFNSFDELVVVPVDQRFDKALSVG